MGKDTKISAKDSYPSPISTGECTSVTPVLRRELIRRKACAATIGRSGFEGEMNNGGDISYTFSPGEYGEPPTMDQALTWQYGKLPWIRLLSNTHIRDENGQDDRLKKLFVLWGESPIYDANEFGKNLDGPYRSLSTGEWYMNQATRRYQNVMNTYNDTFGYLGIDDQGNLGQPASFGPHNNPRPGITQATLGHKGGKGLMKGGQVKFKCYDIESLEACESLYLTPGRTIILEFGWNLQPQDSLTVYGPMDIDSFGPGTDYETQESMENRIRERIISSGGMYGGAFGIVTNFNWTYQAGVYDCTMEFMSKGGKFTAGQQMPGSGQEGARSNFNVGPPGMKNLRASSKNKAILTAFSRVVMNGRYSFDQDRAYYYKLVPGPELKKWYKICKSGEVGKANLGEGYGGISEDGLSWTDGHWWSKDVKKEVDKIVIKRAKLMGIDLNDPGEKIDGYRDPSNTKPPYLFNIKVHEEKTNDGRHQLQYHGIRTNLYDLAQGWCHGINKIYWKKVNPKPKHDQIPGKKPGEWKLFDQAGCQIKRSKFLYTKIGKKQYTSYLYTFKQSFLKQMHKVAGIQDYVDDKMVCGFTTFVGDPALGQPKQITYVSYAFIEDVLVPDLMHSQDIAEDLSVLNLQINEAGGLMRSVHLAQPKVNPDKSVEYPEHTYKGQKGAKVIGSRIAAGRMLFSTEPDRVLLPGVTSPRELDAKLKAMGNDAPSGWPADDADFTPLQRLFKEEFEDDENIKLRKKKGRKRSTGHTKAKYKDMDESADSADFKDKYLEDRLDTCTIPTPNVANIVTEETVSTTTYTYQDNAGEDVDAETRYVTRNQSLGNIETKDEWYRIDPFTGKGYVIYNKQGGEYLPPFYDNDLDSIAGNLRNVFVNIDVVNEALQQYTEDLMTQDGSQASFLMSIVQEIQRCTATTELDIGVMNGNEATSQLVSVKSTPIGMKEGNVDPDAIRAIQESQEEVRIHNSEHAFDLGAGTVESICRDLNLSLKLPDKIKAALMSRSTGANIDNPHWTETGYDIFQQPPNASTNQKSTEVVVGPEGEDGEDLSMFNAINNTILSMASMNGFKAGTSLIAGRPIVEPDGIPIDEYIGNTLPTGLVDFSTTLDGISGFDIGNAVHNKFVLPMRYRAKTIFSVTSIEHTITPGDWSTSLEAFMRLISL